MSTFQLTLNGHLILGDLEPPQHEGQYPEEDHYLMQTEGRYFGSKPSTYERGDLAGYYRELDYRISVGRHKGNQVVVYRGEK